MLYCSPFEFQSTANGVSTPSIKSGLFGMSFRRLGSITHFRELLLTDQAGCTANTHSYYNATSRQCFCSNGTPFQQNLVLGNENACGSAYDNRNIRTSYMSLNPQCYATAPTGITAANTNTFTGLNGCLNSCKNGLRATFWANTAVGPPHTYPSGPIP